MIRRCITLSLLLLSGCVFLPKLWGGPPGDDLFQQALFKESGERNPQAAIALYRRLVEVPGADRMTLFAARLRMVRCYERIGKYSEALEAYEQILKQTSAPQSELSLEVQAELLRLKTRKSLSNAELPVPVSQRSMDKVPGTGLSARVLCSHYFPGRPIVSSSEA